MPTKQPERSPEANEPKKTDPSPDQSYTVNLLNAASDILTGCISGRDIREDFVVMSKMLPHQQQELRNHIATQLLEHFTMLTEPHHWMTLCKGAGKDEYITILQLARVDARGHARLVVSTKLADIIRREDDPAKIPTALLEADEILQEEIASAEKDSQERGGGLEKNPEVLLALGSAYYTHSFVPFGRAALVGEDAKGKGERDSLNDDSLALLVKSAEYSQAGGDKAGAAQSRIRACGVKLDTGRGNPSELVAELEELVTALEGAEGNWGGRFLNNALGRRVEAAAKCQHSQWEKYYRELTTRPSVEQQYGGVEKFKAWQQQYCPPSLRAEEGLAEEE